MTTDHLVAGEALIRRRSGLELDRKSYLEDIAALEQEIGAALVNVRRCNAELDSLNSTILYLQLEDSPPQRPAASAARADS